MSDGATVEVFAPRIFKSNANEVYEKAKKDLSFIHTKLVALACYSPATVEEVDQVAIQIDDLLEWHNTAYFNLVASSRILDEEIL